MSVSYNEIPNKIRNREEFNGSSARGAFVTAVDGGEAPESDVEAIREVIAHNGRGYVVFSYHTPIAAVSEDEQVSFVSNESYSSTTSRLQNICRDSI